MYTYLLWKSISKVVLTTFAVTYVPDLSGIFVRSITEGSAAALDGRIQINDQIIAVCITLLLNYHITYILIFYNYTVSFYLSSARIEFRRQNLTSINNSYDFYVQSLYLKLTAKLSNLNFNGHNMKSLKINHVCLIRNITVANLDV